MGTELLATCQRCDAGDCSQAFENGPGQCCKGLPVDGKYYDHATGKWHKRIVTTHSEPLQPACCPLYHASPNGHNDSVSCDEHTYVLQSSSLGAYAALHLLLGTNITMAGFGSERLGTTIESAHSRGYVSTHLKTHDAVGWHCRSILVLGSLPMT